MPITVIRHSHPKPPSWEPRELLIMLVAAIFWVYVEVETCLADANCQEEMLKWFDS